MLSTANLLRLEREQSDRTDITRTIENHINVFNSNTLRRVRDLSFRRSAHYCNTRHYEIVLFIVANKHRDNLQRLLCIILNGTSYTLMIDLFSLFNAKSNITHTTFSNTSTYRSHSK